MTLIEWIFAIGVSAFLIAVVVSWKLHSLMRDDPINKGAHLKVKRGYEE